MALFGIGKKVDGGIGFKWSGARSVAAEERAVVSAVMSMFDELGYEQYGTALTETNPHGVNPGMTCIYWLMFQPGGGLLNFSLTRTMDRNSTHLALNFVPDPGNKGSDPNPYPRFLQEVDDAVSSVSSGYTTSYHTSRWEPGLYPSTDNFIDPAR